jgi:hypothetical protein
MKSKKTEVRLLIDLPIQVFKILKNDAINNDSFLKLDIEKLCIEKANKLDNKQTELFKKSKQSKDAEK